MREVNFSIPNVNKASVGITTALYDRRALDCTSTLPLINSLNHLAYLTTSSARIRDILTVDGGIERLICILKQGRSKDMMDMWKWNLAFQCVVNIGVRGTEGVRTRVVEADMVPVIATILDNYIQVVEKCREKQEEVKKKFQDPYARTRDRDHRGKASSFTNRNTRVDDQRAFRRQAPPPSIDIGASFAGPSSAAERMTNDGASAAAIPQQVTTPTDRTQFALHHRGVHYRHYPRGAETHPGLPSPSRQIVQPLAAAIQPTMDAAASADGFVRPVRDVDRLPSMMSFTHPPISSQPASPTTPLPPPQIRSPTVRPVSMLAPAIRTRRRPSIRHQNSTATADSDEISADGMQSDESPDAEMSGTTDMQTAVNIQDISMEENDSILAGAAIELNTPTVSETQDAGTFNITHRGPMDGSIANNTAVTPVPAIGLSPNRPAMVTPAQPSMPQTMLPRYLLERHLAPNTQMLAAMPREEDVLMSLQLLAYVSKYCNLRSYFQKSHLVPRLKIGKEIQLLDGDDATIECPLDEELEEEYLLPNDLNIFPLVEKFTVRYHSTDMQYWAGVVMRNLCRKDDTRGGIRQCAYYQCGKWEEFTRQFAKCRRCRRTKYCSKECQKSAWAFHRHWCVAATQ
ncbi:SamB protein [Magnaporthiopsis poae ATCC 64411]|uniref:MYND-type zinc finger protein samB n=1 Tax=Magnaporthiopsis poae (strain ATCC 64411 / 73-15) TaxID=644358 RepID=A0A0C4DWL6_MAGP6|nr:SamB protein [Magnaporthiopsis poae ATCC 64411]